MKYLLSALAIAGTVLICYTLLLLRKKMKLARELEKR